MRCDQARELFDAYLNGELAGSLATELGAHRLHCADCRRALALMEVSGEIVASDRDPVSLRPEFTERLLACVEPPSVTRGQRARRWFYVAAPLAAAAVVALAFLGVFDNPDSMVAGKREVGSPDTAVGGTPSGDVAPSDAATTDPARTREDNERLLDEGMERIRQNLERKRESGESLQQHLDATLLELIEALNQAQPDGADEKPVTDPEGSGEPAPQPPAQKPPSDPKG